MTAEIVEAWTRAKSGHDELNEDAYVVAGDLVAVFDGETDKTGGGIPSPGRQAVLALVEAVSSLPSACPARHVVKLLHEAVAAASAPGCTPVAVGALLDLRSRRIIRVGDVSVGLDGVVHRAEKQLDMIAANARAALLRALIRAGDDVEQLRERDPGRDMILPLLRAASTWRNVTASDLGFAAFDGTATPESMIDVYEVPASAEVVLASDGYFDVRPSLDETEEILAAAVQADPLRIGSPPSTKGVRLGYESYDDRTYVRIRT